MGTLYSSSLYGNVQYLCLQIIPIDAQSERPMHPRTIAERRHIGIRSADCTMSDQLIPLSQSADCKELFQLLSRGQIS
jgi:hypothetical protein